MGSLKRAALSIITALIVFSTQATTAHAAFIPLPDSTPIVESIDIYRNILETGDMLIIAYENTPYAATPAILYSSAFVWRLIDTDNVTEIAQALGFAYDENGFGSNVISFYLDAAEFTAAGLAWGDTLKLRLSGTPVAFAAPPEYNFDISASDYSAETVTSAVRAAITTQVLLLAHSLDVRWGLTPTTTLLDNFETGVVLSVNGQAFFRGAIYGIQSMAPSLFPLVISSIDTSTRTWTTDYSDNLTGTANTGASITAALAAGNTLLDSNYNLFGLLIVLGICLVILFATWYLAGGNLYKGLVEMIPALVIGARMGLMGLGELGLVAALCWLYVSARVWRMI